MELSTNHNPAEQALSADGREQLRTEALQKLGSVHTAVRAASSSGGERFIALGNALQSLYAESESLVAATKSHADVVGEEGHGNPIEEIGSVAGASVDELKTGQENNRSLLGHITNTVGVVRSLSKSVESINVVGSQLGIIGTNLAIQTSRLQSGVETFGDFASEIKSFSAYISRFAADIEQDTEDVVSILSDVKSRMESKTANMQTFIEKARESADLTILEIQSLIRQSSEILTEKSRHSEEIAKQMTQAVIAMQVDDIARQRMEHVAEALEEVKRVGDFSEGRFVLKLQASQIREVSKDLLKAHETMAAAFENIGSEISKMAPAGGSSHPAFQNAAKSVKTLQKTMIGLEKIQLDAEELRDSMSAGLDRAIIASETISRHVVDVSTITQELNLKAINALLMSRQLGTDGGNLVVLAKELHTLSKDSIEFVTSVKEKIEHVAEVTTMLKNTTLARGEHIGGDHQFDKKIHAMDEIVAFYDNAAYEAGRRAVNIQKRIHETETTLQFLKDVSSQLIRTADDIDVVFELTEPLCEQCEETTDAHIHTLYEKYTMEQERKVHRAMHGDVEETEAETATEMSSEDELGDFELF